MEADAEPPRDYNNCRRCSRPTSPESLVFVCVACYEEMLAYKFDRDILLFGRGCAEPGCWKPRQGRSPRCIVHRLRRAVTLERQRAARYRSRLRSRTNRSGYSKAKAAIPVKQRVASRGNKTRAA